MDTPINIRRLIIQHFLKGWTYRRISEATNVPRSTVSDIINNYRRTGSPTTRRHGRSATNSRITTRDDHRIRQISTADPQLTARQIQEEVGGSVSQVHVSTVKRHIVHAGRFAYRPMKSPRFTVKQMRVRLHWCLEHRDWSVDKWRKEY